jgi:hypothetical protein
VLWASHIPLEGPLIWGACGIDQNAILQLGNGLHKWYEK